MLPTAPRAQHSIDLVDEDDAGLKFAREREDGVDELVAVAVPLLRKRRDMQIYERGPRLVRKSFGEHGFAAAGRTVEEDAGGGGEEG